MESVYTIGHFQHNRHNPQFNKENMKKELANNDIEYIWIEKLGGFRKGGYKDYMKTSGWKSGFGVLLESSKKESITAIMCSELLWFRCHRRYVADELKRKKFTVIHIFDDKRADKHKITFRRRVRCEK